MILRCILCAVLGWALTLPGLLPAQERSKFPAGVGTKTLGTSLLWLATKKGFFEEQGIDVQPVLHAQRDHWLVRETLGRPCGREPRGVLEIKARTEPPPWLLPCPPPCPPPVQPCCAG